MSEQNPAVTASAKGREITDEERNGSITAIGIVLGFSLSFLAAWTQNDDPWEMTGIPVLLLLVAGIGMQVRSLYKLLLLPPGTPGLKHRVGVHNDQSKLFLIGTVLVFAGFVLVVLIGMFYDLLHAAPEPVVDAQRVNEFLRGFCIARPN